MHHLSIHLPTMLALLGAMSLLPRADAVSQSGTTTPVRGDTAWYHASDVARLAKTGRPQLLEFFHPS